MKQLKDIIDNCTPIKITGDVNVRIDGIDLDSRAVKDNYVFIATKGSATDGHLFIDKAVENGASCIICQDLPEKLFSNITYVQLSDTQEALFKIASAFYGNPASKLKIIGITGTNGKTTTATILYKLFNNIGHKSALISTIAYYVGDEVLKATHTTPDAIRLNELFSKIVAEGCEYCFMEVSSHAISQQRVEGIDFKGAVFSNITHDHLDYHKTFANYLKAKKSLFDKLPATSYALVNTDDKNGRVMLQNTKATKYTFSLSGDADYKCNIIEKHLDGTLIKINNNEVWTRFAGQFNALNITAAYAVAVLEGLDNIQVLTELSNLQPIRGRFEIVNKDGITAIVDYAHTPDALENILAAINELKESASQLITVVGAGGNRDKAKRPIMAKIAVANSDKVILTSDNPRNEAPDAIIEDMLKGVEQPYKQNVISIENRREAIRTARMIAKSGDIILIAGKGHETYQEIKGVRHDFDDKKVFMEI